MAEATTVEGSGSALAGLGRLSMWRQAALLAALAASIALGVWIALWSREPGYALLYGSLEGSDASAIGQALERADIPYRVEPGSGAILVPAGRVHEARLKLAGEGLPRGSGRGFELLETNQGFGTSQFIERARYQRALEVELARTIGSLRNVRSARVHLAVPRQSAFARARRRASASVLIELFPGRVLGEGQPEAIAHLVAAAVPSLEPSAVRVVDQDGRLLTRPRTPAGEGPSREELDYRSELERRYARRIEEILTPIVGPDRVRAQVSADLDFTITEQARESFNPDAAALRSERVVEEGGELAGTGGVPGALSNAPPGPSRAPEQARGAGALPGTPAQQGGGGRREATRNYELDRTVSHVRRAAATLRRLSVAVVVDAHRTVASDGTVTSRPRSPEELARMTTLVKEAVGFDPARGDSVSVTSAPFSRPPAPEPVPDPPIWEQPWVWDLARQAGGALVVLLLVFGVLRPMMKNLVSRDLAERRAALGAAREGGEAGEVGEVADDRLSLSGRSARPVLPSAGEQVEAVRALVNEDPRRVANVIKEWVNQDG